MANLIQGTVVGKTRWTESLVSVQFEAAIAPFMPGQFTRVGLEIEGEQLARPYSLVNTPDEQPHEIYFNIVPGGPLSPRLAELELGDAILVGARAGGLLTLEEVPAEARQLWLMATGTALGPFLSILKTDTPWQRFEQVILVHAVRHREDLTYGPTIEALLNQHQNRFRFMPFVSRERCNGALHGRIPAALDSGDLEHRLGLRLSPEGAHVMLCGNSGMIKDTTAVLQQRGLRRHLRREPGHISTEKYH